MPLQAQDINDIVVSTQNDLGPPRFINIAQNLQTFFCMSKMIKAGKVEFFDNGIGIERRVNVRTLGSYKRVGFFETQNIVVGDTLKTIQVPWVNVNVHWAYDIKMEMMNRGPAQLVDNIKVYRSNALLDLANGLEYDMFGMPADSTVKGVPFGLPYWIPKNSNLGFFGGDPSGFASGAGGLTVAEAPNWNSYSGTYSAIGKNTGELIPLLRDQIYYTNFVSPVGDDGALNRDVANQFQYLTNRAVQAGFENACEAQNDNVGPDLYWSYNNVTFRRNPIVALPVLDSDATNPIYSINWDTFKMGCLRGNYLRESPPEHVAYQPDTRAVYQHLTFQFFCIDRRRNGVLYAA